jgi:protein arginine kinase activator
LTEVVNDKVTKLHLCEECAEAKSAEMQSHFGLTDLLSGLMDLGPSLPEGDIGQDVMVKCPTCGITYYDFQKTGRLGCGRCYETFTKSLSELLRKIHGSDKHVGKMPFKGEDVLKDQQDLQRLKNELNELIQSEEFEKAALLRDRIKEVEDKLGSWNIDGTG